MGNFQKELSTKSFYFLFLNTSTIIRVAPIDQTCNKHRTIYETRQKNHITISEMFMIRRGDEAAKVYHPCDYLFIPGKDIKHEISFQRSEQTEKLHRQNRVWRGQKIDKRR